MNVQQLKDVLRNTLTATGTVRVATSGYADRYLMCDYAWSAKLVDDTLSGTPTLRWNSQDEARTAILALCEMLDPSSPGDPLGKHWDDVCEMINECHRNIRFVGTWLSDRGRKCCSGEVRWSVLCDFLTSINESVSEQARLSATARLAGMTGNERDFLRWSLAECNRTNQRLVDAGSRVGIDTQVNVPGYEW
jgi:hypothetical protein